MSTMITALHIAEQAELPEPTLDLLDKEQRPTLLLDWLIVEERYLDAIRFMSQGLPDRLAIWWACLGLLLAELPEFTQPEVEVLAGSTRWVIEPAKEHRTAVKEASTQVKQGKPVHLLALALEHASEEKFDKVCGDCVAGALINAALRGKSDLIVGKYQMFLALAVAILQGKYLWTEVKPAPAQPAAKAHRTAVAH